MVVVKKQIHLVLGCPAGGRSACHPALPLLAAGAEEERRHANAASSASFSSCGFPGSEIQINNKRSSVARVEASKESRQCKWYRRWSLRLDEAFILTLNLYSPLRMALLQALQSDLDDGALSYS